MDPQLIQDTVQTMVKDLLFWVIIAACASAAWVGVLAVWRGYWQTKRLQSEYANAWAKKKGRKRY